MLRLLGVTHAALAPLDLTVSPGELVALVGPSSAGKSLALRVIAGFEPLTAGHIWIAGRDVTHAAPTQRDLAVVFPDQPLFAHLTVFENLAFSLRMQRLPDADLAPRVHAAADTLGITRLLDRTPRHLSTGERHRVSLARAVARAPRVILLDEPINLTASASLLRGTGAAIVLATRDASAARTVADRAVDLDDACYLGAGLRTQSRTAL